MMLISLVCVAFGILLTVWGADTLVEGASVLARHFHVSDLTIGLTIVAFGTSVPEFVVGLIAAFKGSTDVTIGNVLGSNVFSMLGILGVTAIICPLIASSSAVRVDIPLALLSAVAVVILVYDGPLGASNAQMSVMTRGDGLILLLFFSVFVYYTILLVKGQKQEALGQTLELPSVSLFSSAWKIPFGLVALVFGGHLIVSGAVDLARHWGASESIIGLTIVAVGTSIPELAAGVAAALKKNVDIAVGNIVGSNIFNSLFVLGSSALVFPLPFHSSNYLDAWANVFVALLLLLMFLFSKGRTIGRPVGILFVALYVLYSLTLIWRHPG